MIFKRGRGAGDDVEDEDEDDAEDEDEEEIDYVLFQGAVNGRDPDLKANARLVQAGLGATKEIVTEAIQRRAEKLRLEPKGERAIVGLYIDGVPYAGRKLSKQQGLAVTQMAKLLAGLDIKERARPQKGTVKAELEGTKYEVDVESTPLGGGAERLTVGIRNPKIKVEKPEELGFPEAMRAKIRKAGLEGKGFIGACGPAGSGVTAASMGIMRTFDAYMYSLFNLADMGGKDIINVVNFQPNPGDDFAATVTRLLRNEAHTVFVDPIRDAGRAKEIFEQQRRVGLVAEFPAKDVAHGVLQLIEWVGSPKAVAEGLRLLVGGKLIRLLCDKCRQAYRPNPKLLAKIGLPPETKVLYRPPRPLTEEEIAAGEEEPDPCRKCGDLRYYGRTGLYEVLEVTDAMRDLIAKGPTAVEIKTQMRKEGMQNLQQEGLRLVAQGKTSLEELQRIFKSPA